MSQLATITSKLQLTIPMSIAKKIGVKSGEKVNIMEEDGRIIITPLRQLIEELAGSIDIPKKLKGKDIDEIIHNAKDNYFRSKNNSI
jgi:AbrB family looped-hinge helix DNA binding protein